MASSWISADWPAPGNVVAGTTLRDTDISDVALDGQPCWLKQVHGAAVVTAGHFDSPPHADGSVSGSAKNVCVVRTADCLPVLMCSADGTTVAAAHAGWRGLASGIIENTVINMAVEPADILVWMGPAISQPSFEVGDEVREAFLNHDVGAESCFVGNSRGRWQADLYALARQKLAAVKVGNVFGGGFCTFEDAQRFCSYRRDGADCGRMVSFVGFKSP